MTTKDEALNATMADSALERMAENERELGLDYMEPALEPTTKQKVDAAVEQYAKTGNGRVLEVALRNIIINETLDKMAKNARELGLDYKPAQKDYKAFYDGKKWCSVEVEQPAPVAKPHEQQEPVGEVFGYYERGFTEQKTLYGKLHNQDLPVGAKLYTSPPASKPWVGLTDEDIETAMPGGIYDCLADPWDCGVGDGDEMRSIKKDVVRVSRAIEAKLKEKNNG